MTSCRPLTLVFLQALDLAQNHNSTAEKRRNREVTDYCYSLRKLFLEKNAAAIANNLPFEQWKKWLTVEKAEALGELLFLRFQCLLCFFMLLIIF